MENYKTEKITAEWLKENGWCHYENTFNKTINGLTYYLVCNRWSVFSHKSLLETRTTPRTLIYEEKFTLLKHIAVVATVQGLEMLTSTGKEHDKNTVIGIGDNDDVISRRWLPENGWRPTFTDGYQKCINDTWYEMEYTDFDCDYILKKEIARLETIEELERVTM